MTVNSQAKRQCAQDRIFGQIINTDSVARYRLYFPKMYSFTLVNYFEELNYVACSAACQRRNTGTRIAADMFTADNLLLIVSKRCFYFIEDI